MQRRSTRGELPPFLPMWERSLFPIGGAISPNTQVSLEGIFFQPFSLTLTQLACVVPEGSQNVIYFLTSL